MGICFQDFPYPEMSEKWDNFIGFGDKLDTFYHELVLGTTTGYLLP